MSGYIPSLQLCENQPLKPMALQVIVTVKPEDEYLRGQECGVIQSLISRGLSMICLATRPWDLSPFALALHLLRENRLWQLLNIVVTSDGDKL